MTMPKPKTNRVFVSYARADGRDYARTLREQLSEFNPWRDVNDIPAGVEWWEAIKEAIEHVESFLLVVTEAALKSAFVRREWVYARRVGVQIVPVTFDPALLERAPRWLRKANVLILNPDYPDYAEQQESLLRQLREPRLPAPVPNTAPAPAETFIERPTLQTQIMERLLAADRAEPRFGVTTLLGAGGFGKTNLAINAANDPDVFEAFTGGIFWVTVGESGQTFVQDMNRILRALHKLEASPEDIILAVRNALADRDCLLVIDDSWKRETIHALVSPPLPQCHYLLTTRESSVAALSAEPISIAEMESNEATALLAKYLPETIDVRAADAKLRALAERLGEWPLLLNIVGITLREQVVIHHRTLENALAYVDEGLDEEGLTAFDRNNVGRSAALEATMRVGLRGLSEDEQQRLFELSIFADDVVVSEAAALALWRGSAGLSDFKSKKLLGRLAGGFTLPEASGAFRLHDRLREWLGKQLSAAEIVAAHVALLATWGDPLALPDNYAYHHYAYHLAGAGRLEELRGLLLNYAWLRAKLEATDLAALLADCDRLRGDSTIRWLRQALTLSGSALAKQKTMLAGQLLARTLADESALAGLRASVPESEVGLLPLNAALAQAGSALQAVMRGHIGRVNGALALDDGSLLSWSKDGTLRRWSPDGQEL
ncbi:MAG: TIR domain-containing protein, partial [Anaerolineae bacterium]|nr:TIR domain-containing protein [Anaerolineae bacterium]